jgi:DNA-binding NarL/FixJ family response regulator
MAIRLVLVDDHPVVLHGLRVLFERHADFSVVDCCADADAGIEAVRRHRPDVLILDLRMPVADGLNVLRVLSSEQIPCRTVLLTAAITDAELKEAVQLGAVGIVMKDSSPDVLADCVRRVHRGEHWIDRDALTRAFRSVVGADVSQPGRGESLTGRELEIVRMVAEGLRNKAIAERLSISEGTVKVHLHNIYDKVGVDGRLELMLYAQQRGLA